jgi:hypothetical protein
MTITQYEMKRIENIKRNQDILNSLGLPVLSAPQPSGQRLAKKKTASLPGNATRRSSRISNTAIEEIPSEPIMEKKKMKKATIFDSSRALNPDLHLFLSADYWLGKPLEEFGKAAVMNLAHPAFAPRFNKYSGVAEWQHSLFLWVNIDGCEYANTWRNNGRNLKWFGGSRMHEYSSVIQRLLASKVEQDVNVQVKKEDDKDKILEKAVVKAEKESDLDASKGKVQDTILLFVRREGEPYCCLGRLQCISADLKQHPIMMEFELLDHPLLLQGEVLQSLH